jgi:hypothetical protein
MMFVFFLITIATAKLYNAPAPEDLAFVRGQLLALLRDYRDGLPRNGADNVVCIPVYTSTTTDSRQRAYAYARHILGHHAGIRVTYESWREYLQRNPGVEYDNRFCMNVSDFDHIKHVLERGELFV